MTVPPPVQPVRPERPGLFVAAVLFHVLEGFFTVVLGTFCVLLLAFAGTIVAANHHGDDVWVAVVAIGATMAFIGLLSSLGLITLFLAYKAWSLERVWVIALMVFSVVSLAVEPCGILVAALTVAGGLQVLDRRDKAVPAAP
jgi:hypothetical protein